MCLIINILVHSMKKRIFLSLGSNLGDREHQLGEAQKLLLEQAGSGVKASGVQASGIYESRAWGYDSNHNFLNCCMSMLTELEPLQVLDAILQIEKGMGRIRSIPGKGQARYADRTIDIDLLLYGTLRLDHPRLVLPHPALARRRFVLVPLNDIASSLVHPVMDLPIGRLLELCEDPGEVWPLVRP